MEEKNSHKLAYFLSDPKGQGWTRPESGTRNSIRETTNPAIPTTALKLQVSQIPDHKTIQKADPKPTTGDATRLATKGFIFSKPTPKRIKNVYVYIWMYMCI